MAKYWTDIENNLIKDIKEETNPNIKNKLILKIYPKLYKMAESIINSYFPYHLSCDREMLISDAITRVIINVHLYKPEYKAYAWCGTTMRNYLHSEIARTSKEKQFNKEALQNSNDLYSDNWNFVTVDKNIDGFDVLTIKEKVLEELNELIKPRELEEDRFSATGYTMTMKKELFGDINIRLVRKELILLKLMKKYLLSMEEFTYERWILSIIIEMETTGYTIRNMMLKMGMDATGIVTIWHSYIDRFKVDEFHIKKSLEKGYDYKYDNQTPDELYRKFGKYYKTRKR